MADTRSNFVSENRKSATSAAEGAPDGRSAMSSECWPASDVALRIGLRDLAGLVTSSFGLFDFLTRVAVLAANAVPGADGAGVTLLRDDKSGHVVEALAASHPFVAEIDRIQYDVAREGPCIAAALDRRPVRSGSLGADRLWPRFGPRVGGLGYHSALSLPLLLPGRHLIGTINMYARATDSFDDRALELGERFAVPAAVAVHNAHLFAQASRLAEQLQTAVSGRPVLDQAVGLIRGRSGETADAAFARLRRISRREQSTMLDVAQRIVDEAVRRAAARDKSTGAGHDGAAAADSGRRGPG